MHIVVTTDGSEAGDGALTAAMRLGKAADARLTLVRVLDPSLDCGDAFASTLKEAVEKTTAEWMSALEATLARAGADGGEVIVVRKQRNESVAAAILRAASGEAASLIAMATRGAGRLRRALVGSVAMSVLSVSDTPVLVTGPQFSETPDDSADGYHVVLATDGSPGSLAAMKRMGEMLSTGRIRISLLQICWPGDADAEDEAQLRTLAASLAHGEDVSVVVRELALIDGASQAIVDVAAELGASAIGMATHGHKGAYHVFAGSVALGVVSRATIPVILDRSSEV